MKVLVEMQSGTHPFSLLEFFFFFDSAVNLSGVKLKCLFLGHYFIVEDDVRELAQMKVDKRFQGILNMLRHCQRFREVRGGGITRFLLL